MIINNNVLNILAKYLIIIGMKIMGLFDKFKSDFDKWEEGAFEEKSSDAYENERQKWIKSGFNGGTGEKTPKMKKNNVEINKRTDENWRNDPRRNTDYRWTDENRWDKD